MDYSSVTDMVVKRGSAERLLHSFIELYDYSHSIEDLKIEKYSINGDDIIIINDIFICRQNDISKDEIIYIFKYFPYILQFIMKCSKLRKVLNLVNAYEQIKELYDGLISLKIIFSNYIVYKPLFYVCYYPSLYFISDLDDKNNFNSLELSWYINGLNFLSKNLCLKYNGRYIYDKNANYMLIYRRPSEPNNIELKLDGMSKSEYADKLLNLFTTLATLSMNGDY